MIRLLHTGDLHLEKGPRFEDTARCLEAMVNDGIEAGVKLWCIGGDLYKTVMGRMMEAEERNFLGPLFQRMGKTGPVVILYGNHDVPGDLDEFGLLESKHPIIVVDRPTWLPLYAGSSNEDARVIVLTLPYPHKRHWIENVTGGSIEEQNKEVEDKLRALFAEWNAVTLKAHAEKSNPKGTPVVSLIHGTFRGCLVSGSEVMPAGQEIEMRVEDIEAVGADYNAGSHIHICQQMGPRSWYAGSPSRSTYGDQDEKGFLIVDVEAGDSEIPIVHRRLTPTRRFQTLKARWSAAGGLELDIPPEIANAECRCRVEFDEVDAGSVPLAEIEARLRAAGAVDVKVERRPIPQDRVRSTEIAAAASIEDKAVVYWETLTPGPGPEQRARCIAKIGELQT